MNPERHQAISDLFERALDVEPDARDAFLDEACADEELRRAVRRLLEHDGAPWEAFADGAVGLGAALAAAPDDDAHAPGRIGAYTIVRRIGTGGMGTVYEAEQEAPRRRVALKVINPGVASPSTLRRFEHEGLVLARLQHVGIAQIFEAGTVDTGAGAQPYFAMELIEGRMPFS